MSRFLRLIGRMFVTMCPTLFGGVFNMLFVKTSVYKKLRRPIDGGRTWSDGQRIFGDNKTFAGFAGMTVGTLLSQVLWGLVLKVTGQSKRSDLYVRHENRAGFNALAGGLFGFAYALMELPNSFAKRRFEIRPGKTEKGLVGVLRHRHDRLHVRRHAGAVLPDPDEHPEILRVHRLRRCHPLPGEPGHVQDRDPQKLLTH